MKINGFELVDQNKLDRVVLGVVGRAGELVGGLGEEVLEGNPELVLAHYDKAGGYILKDGVKIKTGSFWDFKKKAPREKPEIKYIFNWAGDMIEVDDPAKLSEAVTILQNVTREKEEKVKEKMTKAKAKRLAKV